MLIAPSSPRTRSPNAPARGPACAQVLLACALSASAAPAAENAPASGPMLLTISLQEQNLRVFRGGQLVATSPVSSGRRGNETPTGVFTILQKKKMHHSNLYDDAPMPFMQRLSWNGVALHQGALPGRAASHGCVRLPGPFARALYGQTRMGTVVVIDEQAWPATALGQTVAMPLRGGVVDEFAKDGSRIDWHWNPRASLNGDVAVLVSSRDRKVRVLRNGVEIGSAPANVVSPMEGTLVYSLVPDGSGTWMARPMFDHPSSTAPSVEVDPMFAAWVETTYKPGNLMVLTSHSLRGVAPVPKQLPLPAAIGTW